MTTSDAARQELNAREILQRASVAGSSITSFEVKSTRIHTSALGQTATKHQRFVQIGEDWYKRVNQPDGTSRELLYSQGTLYHRKSSDQAWSGPGSEGLHVTAKTDIQPSQDVASIVYGLDFAMLSDVSREGDEVLADQAMYKVTASFPVPVTSLVDFPSRVRQLLTERSDDLGIRRLDEAAADSADHAYGKAELWIGQADFWVYRLVIETRFTRESNQVGSLVETSDYSRFNSVGDFPVFPPRNQ